MSSIDVSMDSFLKNLAKKFNPPTTNITHRLIDYIEFYCFFSADSISKSECLDLLEDNSVDIRRFFNTHKDFEDFEEPDENTDEVCSIKEQCMNNAFDYLFYRAGLIGEMYPFIMEKNSIKIKDEISIENKVYLLLLFSSMLNRFGEFQSTFTSDFESTSAYAMSKMYPNFEIRDFGKKSKYSGSARDKIILLANDMKLKTNTLEINKLNRGNNQEKGLDIILWQPFKDEIPNMMVFLVQCSCGEDWVKKFSETKRYRKYLVFDDFPPIIFFSTSLGLCFRGEFSQSDDIASSDSLVLDRFRIMHLISGFTEEDSFAKDSLNVIDKLIDKKRYIEENR